jgi:hypothetical protein
MELDLRIAERKVRLYVASIERLCNAAVELDVLFRHDSFS